MVGGFVLFPNLGGFISSVWRKVCDIQPAKMTANQRQKQYHKYSLFKHMSNSRACNKYSDFVHTYFHISLSLASYKNKNIFTFLYSIFLYKQLCKNDLTKDSKQKTISPCTLTGTSNIAQEFRYPFLPLGRWEDGRKAVIMLMEDLQAHFCDSTIFSQGLTPCKILVLILHSITLWFLCKIGVRVVHHGYFGTILWIAPGSTLQASWPQEFYSAACSCLHI